MLTLLASALAVPGPTTLPDYAPGDSFVFSDRRVERVIAADDDYITWAGLSGPSYKRSRNFIIPVLQWRTGRAAGTREVRGKPDEIWPLDRPRSGRFRVITNIKTNPQATAKRSASLWACKTSKARNFTVAAGTYNAIPVVCDRYSSTTMRLIERREWDYAPDLGHYVRRVSLNYLRGTTRTVELVAALSGPAATKARLTALSKQARTGQLARRTP